MNINELISRLPVDDHFLEEDADFPPMHRWWSVALGESIWTEDERRQIDDKPQLAQLRRRMFQRAAFGPPPGPLGRTLRFVAEHSHAATLATAALLAVTTVAFFYHP